MDVCSGTVQFSTEYFLWMFVQVQFSTEYFFWMFVQVQFISVQSTFCGCFFRYGVQFSTEYFLRFLFSYSSFHYRVLLVDVCSGSDTFFGVLNEIKASDLATSVQYNIVQYKTIKNEICTTQYKTKYNTIVQYSTVQ